MPSRLGRAGVGVTAGLAAGVLLARSLVRSSAPVRVEVAAVHPAVRFDVSPPLGALHPPADRPTGPDCAGGCGIAPPTDPDHDDDPTDRSNGAPVIPPISAAAARVEQRTQGIRPALPVLASFDGLGAGFSGPQGEPLRPLRNPSDNALAVGRDDIVQIVNGGMAVFTKKGSRYDTTGKVLYGPVRTNAIFTGFGGPCEALNSGDAVVRYDQLADRWLYVLPIFQRSTTAPIELSRVSVPGQSHQPGEPGPAGLINTPPPPPSQPVPGAGRGRGRAGGTPPSSSPYSMCYAVSTGPDPLGPYYRYQFLRPLFPDYPRPAVWPDGYYIPTSTGDNVIQKHDCIADRRKMLQGLPATEQCVIIDGSNFLNNADIDGQGLPPVGAPNIMMAAGGSQLRRIFGDNGIDVYQVHVDWDNPANTGVSGPTRIAVAPYHYLCDGQLTMCVPQPGTDQRLDAQGDKLMQRLVYRNINGREVIVGLHSINTTTHGGGVRWYEFQLDGKREPYLLQQGTYAPDSLYRWMGSIDVDRQGNIGIGYSYGGATEFPGQRFAARKAGDPPGVLTFHESVLARGEASQPAPSPPALPRNLRWEDYATTAMDPSDDCTFWYVGDYLKSGATTYSSRIGAFRVPGCLQATITGSTYFDRNHNGVRDAGEPGIAAWPVRYRGAESGQLRSDASGGFSIVVPADSVYADVSYSFTATAPAQRRWHATEGAASRGGSPIAPQHDAVARVANGYQVHVRDLDYVTGVDFGSVCTVPGRGGRNAAFWSGASGRAILMVHDSAWRALVDSTLHLAAVAASGTRFTVARTGSDAYDRLRDWLRPSESVPPRQRESIALLVLDLNVQFGSLDGTATVADPVMHDWPTFDELVGRAAKVLATPPGSSTSAYTTLLESLNENTATITPSHPSSCPKPF